MYVTVTLLNREQCYGKNMEKKIHESDEHAFFLAAVFLQYLQTCLLSKPYPNQYKTTYKLKQKKCLKFSEF